MYGKQDSTEVFLEFSFSLVLILSCLIFVQIIQAGKLKIEDRWKVGELSFALNHLNLARY